MNKEMYEIELKALEGEFEAEKFSLVVEFCNGHSTIAVGDTVTDGVGSVIVEKINYSTRDLCCVYYGLELTKKLIPRKDGAKRNVWQSRVESHAVGAQ